MIVDTTIDTSKLTEGSHKVVLLSCDSMRNDKCLRVFTREWRVRVQQQKRIGNKDYCKYCQKTEEYTGRGNPNAKYFFDDNLLNNIDTAQKAYLLGWVASDGCISSDKITISVRDYDVDVLLKLRSIVDNNLPIAEKDNMVSLSICSSTMALACINHLGLTSFGKKDTLVKYPNISEELNQYFIRGYFEGDGSICLKNDSIPRVNIASNSSSMLTSILNILGYGAVYTNQWQANAGKDALKFLQFIYQDTLNLVLERKFNNFSMYEDWVPSLSGTGTYTKLNTPSGIIKFNKSRVDAVLPSITDIHASGIDLTIIEKVKDFTGDTALYTTGIKVKPPEGYYFMLVGRSSISKSGYSLANGIGIIDENYIGEILVPLRKHTTDELSLPNRIVQLVLLPKLNFEFIEVDSLEDTERGSGGFGSTGV